MFGVKEHKEKLEIAVSEILETEGQKLQITRCCRIGRAAVGYCGQCRYGSDC